MKFCQPHWDKLRVGIAEAGMDGLVAKDGVQAAAQLASGIQSGSTASNFDPLMAAHNMILSNAMNLLGQEALVLFTDDDQGPKCPLCYLTKIHLERCTEPGCPLKDHDHWIGFAIRDAKAEAVRLGLVGAA